MTTSAPANGIERWRSSIARALELLVHSNLFISLATMSVVLTTMLLAGLPVDPLPLFFVFAVTMFVYTINRLTDLAEDETNVPRRAALTRQYGHLWLAAGTCLYLVAIAIAVFLGVPGAGYMLIPLVVALLYSTVGIKQLFLVKNCFVGLAWGLLPAGAGYYYRELWTTDVLFLVGYVAAMITIAAVIFDIKDIEGDREEGIATVPNVFGPRRTRIVTQSANVAVAVAVIALVASGVLSSAFLVVLAMNGYVALYIPFAKPEYGPLYYGFVVDGEHVFLAAVVCALELVVW
ncbi:UbiA family prenyltransferase [Natrialba asiatica]|uniref:Prenyltransferase n=1 Tax=Natrialba asiatica (strain ATCC 700177 / DSM 12278 / JCM 9576 / FERM P-10747 / NBRC 102637 / 172P1) TaxID=29540 RepID=M0ATJ4_NATA1|nr:UbiA family prenyltransferase [Natrialba asiatica]ELZ02001.1 prenyltransferase [Natrialba asiatica DSM 12278]